MAQKSKERQSWSDSLSQDLQRDSKEMKGNQGSTAMSRMRLASVQKLWLMKKKKSLQRLNSLGKDLFLTLSQVLPRDHTENHLLGQDLQLIISKKKKLMLKKWFLKFNKIKYQNYSLVSYLKMLLKMTFIVLLKNMVILLTVFLSTKIMEVLPL